MQSVTVDRRFPRGCLGYPGFGPLLVVWGVVALVAGGCPNAALLEDGAQDGAPDVVASAEAGMDATFPPAGHAALVGGELQTAADRGTLPPVNALPPTYLGDKNLYYTVSPNEGPRNLTVTASVHTVSGLPLPKGTCTWSFDDAVVTGPMRTHATVQHTFTTGGLHTVRLLVTMAGVVQTVACDPPSGANVAVRPLVTGRIVDSANRPVTGVAVMAAGAQAPATTNDAGQYALMVPYGWSGTVAPSDSAYTFEPPNRSFSTIRADTPGGDFVATSVANQPPTASAQSVTVTEDVATGIALSGSDPEGSALTYVVVALPAIGTLKDVVTGHVILAGELPYTLASGGKNVTYATNLQHIGAELCVPGERRTGRQRVGQRERDRRVR